MASKENSTSGALSFTGNGSPPGSGAFRSWSRFSSLVCFQSRQIETWAWPARSPTVLSPEAALIHSLCIFDNAVDAHVMMLLHRSPQRLDGDVVESAVVVAPRWVVFGCLPVPGDALLEALDCREETPRGIEVLDVLQDEVLGPDQLVRLRQIGDAAVPYYLLAHPRHQRVRGDPGEGVGSSALESNLELGRRLLGAPHRVHLLQPSPHDGFGPFEIPPEAPLQAHELVRQVVYRVSVLFQVRPEHTVRHSLLSALVEHEHGPHVRVDHETAQGPKEQIQVVRCALLPALRVGNADYAVYVLVRVGDAFHLEFQRPDESGEPRSDAHHYYVVTRPNAPARSAPVAHEGAWLVVERNLLAGAELLLVEDVGLKFGVAEIRLFGQLQADHVLPSRNTPPALIGSSFRILIFATFRRDAQTLAEDAQDLLVARVIAGLDVPYCATETETPGEQILPFCYGLDGEAVAF